MCSRRALLFGLLLLALGAAQVYGDEFLYTIGNNAAFTDGQFLTTGDYAAAVALQPAPFDQFYGDDDFGPDFSAIWTFSPAALPFINAAYITIGMWDHDAAASGSQVASFVLNGTTDLTSALDAALEAKGGQNLQYNVYTVAIPSSAFGALRGGAASFALTLQGPGLGLDLGFGPETTNNGAGLVFSTLDLETPEPGGFILGGLGLLGLLGFARLRR